MGDEADRLNEWGDAEHGEEVAIRMERDALRKQRDKSRAFKAAVKREVDRQLKNAGLDKKPAKPRGAMVDRICSCGCGTQFKARSADVKRGWGRFSSKACAAKFKDQKNRGRYRDSYGT